MANYGALTAKIYEQSDLTTAVATYTSVISARGTMLLNRVGNGELTLKLQSDDAPYTNLTRGNIAVVYINDGIASADLMVACFTIEELHTKTKRDGMSEVRVSGRDMLGELSGYLHFIDIGEQYATTRVTNAANGATEIEPDQVGTVETELSTSPGSGATVIDVDDESGFNTGDPILIQLDANGGENSHLTTVVSTAAGEITIEDKMPSGSSTNNKVTLPECFLDDSIAIDLDDGSIHYTRIDEQPGPERFHIDVGLQDSSTSGAPLNDIQVTSSQNPTTDDIYYIMEPATNTDVPVARRWTLDTSAAGTPAGGSDLGGTGDGSGHKNDGATIMQLLTNTVGLTGEWFRHERTSATTAERTLAWRASSDSSGISLTMPTTQAAGATVYADTTKGIIHSLTSETRWKIANVIVPQGVGDFHLADKTDADEVNYPGSYVDGRWRVTNSLITDYTYIHYVTFNGIEPETSSLNSKAKAANELYRQSVLYLQNNDDTEEFKRVKTVLHADVLPGQSVLMAYSETDWTEADTVYIVEINHSVGRNGVRYTDLLLSETAPYNRETAESLLAAGSGSAGGATSVGGSSGGGTPGGTGHNPVTISSSYPVGSLTIDGAQAITFAVADGDGLSAGTGELSLGTPSTNTAATSNALTASSHTHAITTTADAYTTASTILAGDANGRLQLAGLDIGNVTTPSDHLVLDTAVDAQGEGYVSARSGGFTSEWKIDTGEGAAYFAYMEADQFHIRLFQADVTTAKGNGLLITDSVGVVSDDFTVPAVSSTVAIIVDDNPALGDAQVFEEDDWVYLRAFNRSGGTASLFDLWGQVTSYSDNADATQDWTLTVENAGTGSGAVGKTIQAGAPVMGYGKSGSGWILFDANKQQGPSMTIGTWAGANPYTPANRSTNFMAGRLLALTGYDEYGFFAGQNGIDGPHILVTERTVEFQDVDITMREGTADGGYIRIHAIELNSDIETAVAPNGDTGISNLTRSSGTNDYYTYVDNNPQSGQPDADYIYNAVGESGWALFAVEDITHTLTTLEVEAYIVPGGFTDDTCQLRAQMFKVDGTTELTDEVKLGSESTSAGLVTIPFTGLDTTALDADWATAQLKLTWTYFIKGSTDVINVNTSTGITIKGITDAGDIPSNTIYTATDYSSIPTALTFETSSTAHGGALYADQVSGAGPWMHLRAVGTTSVLYLEALSTTNNKYAKVELTGTPSNGVQSKVVVDIDTVDVVEIIDDIIDLNVSTRVNNNLKVSGGMKVGTISGADPDTGQLVLDQGAGDDAIIEMYSSDVDHSVGGLSSSELYGQMLKAGAATGGLLIDGLTETNVGLYFRGWATTSSTVTTTAAVAPITMSSYVNDSAPGSTNNVVALRAGALARWILKGNGDTHQDGDMYDAVDFTPDFLESDVEMLRATMLASGKALPMPIDKRVRYNANDLKKHKLIIDGKRNRSRISELQSGSIIELEQRIAELEAKLDELN